MNALEKYQAEIVRRVTAAMREADKAFESVGGSTRHHVRECLMPALKAEGLEVVDAEVVRRATSVSGLENVVRDIAAERDAALAAVAQLRGALAETLANDCYHPDNLPEGDERCQRANAALASTTLGAGWLSPERVRELMERAWNFGAGPFDSMEHYRTSDARRKADIDALLAEVRP